MLMVNVAVCIRVMENDVSVCRALSSQQEGSGSRRHSART